MDYLIIRVKEIGLAAYGGQLMFDVYGNVPDLNWNDLKKLFLKT